MDLLCRNQLGEIRDAEVVLDLEKSRGGSCRHLRSMFPSMHSWLASSALSCFSCQPNSHLRIVDFFLKWILSGGD